MSERRHALEEEFHRLAGTDVIGREIEWYSTLTSTNARALELAARTCKEGTVVVADEQTGGRGRLGRDWYSPKGGGLWFSVVLYPLQSMAEVPTLTILTAEAVREFLEAEFSIPARIKEPNDLMVDGRKICGILAEASTRAGAGKVDYVVVGIGVNLDLDFPPELSESATSVAQHFDGNLPPRSSLLARAVEHMEKRYLI